ncbi:MAG: Fic family protein [Micropruina sp.]|uniref:Fic family protein n=1 Tax=Micropruina sp. TaxID=2737536 RepID=UPI0039E34409
MGAPRHADARGSSWPAPTWETHPWHDSWRDYEAAVVPPIATLDVCEVLDAATAARVGAAQQAIVDFDRELTEEFGARESGTTNTVLLRSEAASSSQIEHLTVSAKQLALAEVGAARSVNAGIVQANVTAMTDATAVEGGLDTSVATQMHQQLLGDTGLHIGLRHEQVWIGTSGSSPLGAEFVAPHHSHVEENLDDLWRFLAEPARLPLAQIAVGHAQFETIHPFVDGNGRVGRALVHRYLRHVGLTTHVTVPISAGLLAATGSYVAALTEYRKGNPLPIVIEFARASRDAAAIGREMLAGLRAVRDSWNTRITARSDSVAWKIADNLVGHPAVAADIAAQQHGVSPQAARTAIGHLVDVGVLKRASTGRRNQVWVAEEITSCYDRIAVLIGRRTIY